MTAAVGSTVSSKLQLTCYKDSCISEQVHGDIYCSGGRYIIEAHLLFSWKHSSLINLLNDELLFEILIFFFFFFFFMYGECWIASPAILSSSDGESQ